MRILALAFAAIIAIVSPQTAFAGKMKETKEIIAATPDKATIVFLRPGKFVGAAVAVPVFEVREADVAFAGLVDAGSKFSYTVDPGERHFATTVFGGESGVRLYRATVEAGKIYYFRARIIDGIWGLEPVHSTSLNSPEFKKWVNGTDNTVNSEKTIAWGRDNLANVTARIRQAEPNARFSTENSLNTDDGH